MSRLWDKGEPLDDRILRYTAGDDHHLDERLVAYDVQASIAHAEMLGEVELLTADDVVAIRNGLTTLGVEHAAGEWTISLEDEDCHSALESRLTARIGEAGGRLHLGRSRNDQVLAALRLYLRDETGHLAKAAREGATALEALIDDQGEIVLPGYTHQQQAMPSSVALWAGSFASELRDDALGLDGVDRRLAKNPLGSAAGYGVPLLPLDREDTRRRLGFDEVHEPVSAVQLSRGKAEAQLAFEISLLMQDFGRMAADLVLFASQELGFVELPASMTTGSSIMPQKRNPDVFELVRGRTATAQAALVEVMAVTAKLPSGYHRDLQLLKAPLFRAIDLAKETAAIVAHAIPGLRFRPDKVELHPGIHAAEAAYRLVLDEGIPFREAYRRVAEELDSPD